jgi:hypothetical protein
MNRWLGAVMKILWAILTVPEYRCQQYRSFAKQVQCWLRYLGGEFTGFSWSGVTFLPQADRRSLDCGWETDIGYASLVVG